LKSGLLGVSASGAAPVFFVAGLGLGCADPAGAFWVAARGAMPMGLICASAGVAINPAAAVTFSNAKTRDIELNLFISNENPASLQQHTALAGHPPVVLTQECVRFRAALESQTNP
jgi:hypothetical protein